MLELTSLLLSLERGQPVNELMDELYPRLRENVDPIQSVDNLCRALSLEREELDFILSLDDDERYTEIKILKKDLTVRTVYDPHPKLRKVQRRIKNRIFSNVIYPKYLYGSLSDPLFPRDYVRCAQVHCQSKTIAKVDIRNFFDNIERGLVAKVFVEICSLPLEVSEVLADLCTRMGYVPQGAPTSSFIANLCVFGEADVYKKLNYQRIKYTRLVDDITLSSGKVDFDMSKPLALVVGLLGSNGFQINEAKTCVESVSTKASTVHGLRVNQATPQLPRKEIRIIRAAVHDLKKKASLPNARVGFEFRKLFDRVSGRVNMLKRLDHPRYPTLRRQLKAITPLPSKKDIRRCQLMLERLERDHVQHSGSGLFRKRFNRLSHRLGLLKRTYDRAAKDLRGRLKDVRPGSLSDE